MYDNAPIVAGPHDRDGALVSTLSDGSVVLAFRGTLVAEDLTSVLDWLNDFHSEHTEAQGFPGRIHAGFLDSLNSVWTGVIDTLEGGDHTTSIPWKKKLYITGHSKGGAVAQLAAVRLQALNPTVVTFAAPMCGDAEFAAMYPEGILTRYEAESDIVPFLPPLGYKAAGKVIAQDPNPDWMRKLKIDRLIAMWKWETVSSAHHLATTYRNWLVDNNSPPPVAARLVA